MNQNFKFISNDFKSSIIVFLVALPLCLGIALASGMPLFSGIIAGAIGGIVVGYLSNSQLSVTGPAAGLTSIVLASRMELGTNEAFFFALFVAGILQIILSFVKAGMIAYYIPSNVIKGMLAAIGIIIIMKQIPHALGWDKDSEGDFSFMQVDGENTFTELWNSLWHIDIGVIIISILGILILVYWNRVPIQWLKKIPAGLMAVLVGILLNFVFQYVFPQFVVGKEHLVQLPLVSNSDEFFKLFSFPDFSQWHNINIYIIALTMALVASLETLLSIEAIDKLDVEKRTTDTTRELLAQGIGNSFSGLIGGLPITSVIVRSSANMDSGAKTKLSTIFHGFLLITCFLAIPNILNLIPYGSLAAILIVTGYKLSHPKIYKEMYRLGKWQFYPFLITLVSIYLIDLLYGVVIGLLISIMFILIRNIRNPMTYIDKSLKKNNIIKLELNNELTFLNKAQTILTLSNIPENTNVILDARKTTHVDYDILEELKEFINIIVPLKGIKLTTIGFRTGFGIKNTTSIYDEILGKDVDEDKLEIHAKELQEKITPEKALELMKQGNYRFVNNLKLNRDILGQVNATSDYQYPYAVVLSCIDSRTSAEIIFDKGLGDLFSIRIAGNVLNKDILGSMEFACNVIGSKLIVVLGHNKCGAIKGACDDVKMGNLTHLIDKIKPAVKIISEKLGIEPTSKNSDFVEEVSHLNVKLVKEEVLKQSDILNNLVLENKIMIVGGWYNIDTGEVEFYED